MIEPVSDIDVVAKPVERVSPRIKPAKLSWWLWIPFAWLFIASSRSIATWLAGGRIDRGTSDLADVSGSPVDRLVLTLMIVLSLIVLYLRRERTGKILAYNKWLVVLFGYVLLSILWSNFPDISLRRSIRCVGMLLAVLIVLTESSPLDAVRTLLRRLYLVHIPLSIAAIKYFRNIGVVYDWSGSEEMWVGLSVHKNNLGQVTMCSGLVASWQVFQNWAKKKLTLDLLLLILTLWLLRGSKNSHSSTSMVGFLCGFLVLLGLQFVKKRARQAKRIVLVGMICLTLVMPLAYFSFEMAGSTPLGLVLSATGRDMTFTGRTGLWQDLLDNAKRSPILGVGYGAFWVGHIGYNMYPLKNWSLATPEWRPNEGHNGYLDVYVDLGAVGLGLLLIVLILAFRGALDDLQNQFEMGVLRLALLLSIVLNNFTESSFLKGTHSLWFVFLLVAINIPRAKTRLRPPVLQLDVPEEVVAEAPVPKVGNSALSVGSNRFSEILSR